MYFGRLMPQGMSLLSAILFSVGTMADLSYKRPAQPDQQFLDSFNGTANATNNVIPGGSPFFYRRNPANDLFKIERISMTPTPCQIGIPCDISAEGTFTKAIPELKLDFTVAAQSPEGEWVTVIASNDDLCRWATLKQGGQSRGNCGAAEGAATIDMEMKLPHGFVPEGFYYIEAKLKDANTVATDVGAKIELKEIMQASRLDTGCVATA